VIITYEVWKANKHIGHHLSKVVYRGRLVAFQMKIGSCFKRIEVPLKAVSFQISGNEFGIRYVLDITKKSKAQIKYLSDKHEFYIP
jgi:hypothetical protein